MLMIRIDGVRVDTNEGEIKIDCEVGGVPVRYVDDDSS